MLVDELEQFKKDHLKGLHEQYGECRYCRQLARFETIFPWDEEKCNEAATELCKCTSATIYASKKRRKEKAEKLIEKKFGEAAETQLSEETRKVLYLAAGEITEDRMDKVTMTIGKLKIQISETAKGGIRIEHTATKKNVEEV